MIFYLKQVDENKTATSLVYFKKIQTTFADAMPEYISTHIGSTSRYCRVIRPSTKTSPDFPTVHHNQPVPTWWAACKSAKTQLEVYLFGAFTLSLEMALNRWFDDSCRFVYNSNRRSVLQNPASSSRHLLRGTPCPSFCRCCL